MSCPSAATPLNPTTTCQDTDESPVCFSVSNLTPESATVVGYVGGVQYCFTAPPVSPDTPLALTTVVVGVPSSWTITGVTTGRVYYSAFTIQGPTTLYLTDTPDYVFYNQHRAVPWPLLTFVAALAAVIIAAYGSYLNRRARSDVCSRYPDLCTLLEARDPKSGRQSLNGYPSGFRKNDWLLPAGLLGILAVGLGAGWYASIGGFGFSTLGTATCVARQGGWGWTALNETWWARVAVQWFGLGKCANAVDESNCFVFSKQTNPAYAYDTTKAQTVGPAFACSCVDTTNPVLAVDCTSSNSTNVCSLCAT
jgi:hypothetical protein